MKKNTFSVAVATIAFAFFFIACGGEDCTGDECNEPVDDSVITDTEPTDDVEPVDDNEVTDDIETDDIIDEEPDEDTIPVNCANDEACQEICKNFLDIQGKWNRIASDMSDGSIDVVLTVEIEQCRISISGQGSFTWLGSNYQQLGSYQGSSLFFYLEKEGENLFIKGKETEDGEIVATRTYIR